MGLFSTLTSHEDKSTTTTSSLDLPAVVQLYRSAPVQLKTSLMSSNTSIPSFAVLSYSAVPVTHNEDVEEEDETKGQLLRSSSNPAKKDAPPPELGVWNCHVMSSSSSRASDEVLLQIPFTSTFCLTIDLSKPEQVEPTLSLLSGTLIRYLIATKDPPTTSTSPDAPLPTATTSLYALRSVSFGLAEEDEDSAAKLSGEAPDESDRKVNVSLVFCARLAPPQDDKPEEDSYRDRQVQALLFYHLRRYAAALNANLCFVSAGEQQQDATVNASDVQPSLSLAQLAWVFRELAQGKAVDDARLLQEESTATRTSGSLQVKDDESSSSSTSPHSLVYGPDHHNEDLIESVLLRNANYPGHWDASKQSLWKILPPEESGALNQTAQTETSKTVGDQGWLTELRDSVSAVAEPKVKTPPRKNKEEPSSAKKTPKDAEISSYFQSLLSSEKKSNK